MLTLTTMGLQAIQDEKAAEKHAVGSGRHLEMSERQMYWDRIAAARAVLKEMQDMHLPWSERRKAAAVQPASKSHTQEATRDQQPADTESKDTLAAAAEQGACPDCF